MSAGSGLDMGMELEEGLEGGNALKSVGFGVGEGSSFDGGKGHEGVMDNDKAAGGKGEGVKEG